MSIEIAHLALQLVGPLQSWGCESEFRHRNTGRFPTKSAIGGMVCAAMQVARGSKEEGDVLEAIRETQLLVITLPRLDESGVKLPQCQITDYHTIGGGYDRNDPNERQHIPLTANKDSKGNPTRKGEKKQTVPTYRQFLNDTSFVAVLSGERIFLTKVSEALADPKWGLWLGRKSCIPAEPVLVGLFDDEESALCKLLSNRSLSEFVYQQEVIDFEDGQDTLRDQPLNFDSAKRTFTSRRVRAVEPTSRQPE